MKNFTFAKTLFMGLFSFFLCTQLNSQVNLTITMSDSWGDGWNGGSVEIIDASGCSVASASGPFDVDNAVGGDNGSSGIDMFSLPDNACYSIVVVPGSYPGEMSWDITLDADGSSWQSGGGNDGTITGAILGTGVCDVYGCTNPGAGNYDPAATCDDGSCLSCTPATFANNTVVDNCSSTGDFAVSFDVSSLGSASSIVVTNDGGGVNPANITAAATSIQVTGFAPGSGTVTVTLTPDDDASCTQTFTASIPALCPPANDDICNATTIVCGGTSSGSTTGATLDTPPTGGDCGSGGAIGNNVWYKIAGTGDDITASLCSSGFDTRIDVYCETSGTCSGGTFECIGGNDDACSGTRSSFTFASAAGNTYYIAVHGYNTSTGTYQLDVTCAAPAGPPPANDDCAGGTGCRFFGSAEALTVGTSCVTTAGDNTTAATGPNPSCDAFGVIKDVWYSFTAPSTGAVNIDVALGTATEMEVAVYDACGGTETGCGDIDAGGENIDLTGLTVGSTYYVQVWSATAEAGTFDICVKQAVVNDDCLSAVNINGGGTAGVPTGTPVASTTAGATDSGIAASSTAPCVGADNPDDDVWFEFTTDTNGGDVTITIDPTGGIGSPVCEVFSGACGALTSITCGTTSTVLSGTTANTTYYIRVFDSGAGFSGGGSANRAAGGFTIEVAGSALPAEVTSFTGKAMEKSNMLMWETATEQNTAEFAIERSIDGRDNWETVGTTAAAGNSDSDLYYELEDMRPVSQAYYRLRITDLDGSSQLSDLVSIKREVSGFDVVLVAPNPTNGVTTVTYEAVSDADVQVVLTDMTGKVISVTSQYAQRGLNNAQIDLRNAPSGVYFMTMNNGVNNVTRRIVKN